jgi:BrnA antitoxin of type II toxin-antitoxin system
VRIDADVLAWLRAQGKGYQSRINAILRREMLAATGTEGGGGFREEGPSGKSREISGKRGDTLRGARKR